MQINLFIYLTNKAADSNFLVVLLPNSEVQQPQWDQMLTIQVTNTMYIKQVNLLFCLQLNGLSILEKKISKLLCALDIILKIYYHL